MRLGLIMVVSGCNRTIIFESAVPATAIQSTKPLDKSAGFGEFAAVLRARGEGSNDMAGYKLATYQSAEGPRAGLVVGDKVFDAAKLTKRPDYATVLGILEDWRTARGLLEKAAAKPGKAVS